MSPRPSSASTRLLAALSLSASFQHIAALGMPSLWSRDATSQNATQIPLPYSVPPSQYFEGNDGPWSTFPVQAGNQPQTVRVLPSTVGTFTWLVGADGCPAQYASAVPNCPQNRGGIFYTNESITWTEHSTYQFMIEDNLNLDSSGDAGFDTLTLGFQGSGGPSDNHSVIFSYIDSKYWLGEFGLRPYPTNFSNMNSPQPSFQQSLFANNATPSLAYSYTAGNQYRLNKVFGSLILGGFDQNRFTGPGITVTMNGDISRDLVVNLQSIKTDSGSTKNLLPKGEIPIFIDSTIPQMYLPDEACTAFEKAFGITYNTNYNHYILNDTQRSNLLQTNPNVTFTIANEPSGGQTVDVVLPYSAFDLTLQYPNVANATHYFPLQKAANESQYTLGRVFLQEAYLIADYERMNFTVAPCSWDPNVITTQNIKSILSPTKYPNGGSSSDSSSSSSSGISGGAIAGIVIGIVAVIAIIGAILFFLRRRSNNNKRRLAELEAHEAQAQQAQDSKGEYYAVQQGGELDAAQERFELGSQQKHHMAEMSSGDYYGPGKGFAHEMEGAAQIHEMPGSEVQEMPAGHGMRDDKK